MFFKDTAREKNLIDKELDMYRRERMLSVDIEVNSYKNSKVKGMETLALECAKQTADYEHTFHSEEERKGVELAKLDGKIAAKADIIKKAEKYEMVVADMEKYKGTTEAQAVIIDSLKKMLDRADENMKVVIAKLSKVDVDKIAVSVGPVNANK